MPQLDGLRAFAIMSVLVHHFMNPELLPRLPHVPSWGLLGVRLFFVLSGFLITGILIRARDTVDAGHAQRRKVLERFYQRRAMRIFPIYYLVLALALVFGNAEAREQLPWLATYTYNFWVSAQGWYGLYFSQFWSLCVEEQFYLLWPWIIILAPRRRWIAIVIAMIIAGPAYRGIALALQFNGVASYALTPSSLDALGMGALLAVWCGGEPVTARTERSLRLSVLPVGLIGLVLIADLRFVPSVLNETLVALVFMWLVAGASRGFGGFGRAILEAKPIRYIGKISYGIYVYFLLVPTFVRSMMGALSVGPQPDSFAEFVLFAAVTVVLASVSWHFFESPINALKQRFPSAPRPFLS